MKRKIQLIILAIFTLTSGTLAHARYQREPEPIPVRQVNKVKITRRGKASWYSKRDRGIRRRTANNEVFDDQEMTCAIWGVPFHQKIRVTNLDNGKSVIVRVNDRGPHRRYVRRGRVIDLTKKAFSKIASLKRGLINVEIEFL